MTTGDLKSIAQGIESQFADTWTLGQEDLNKPATESVLNNLITLSPESCRQRMEREFFREGPLEDLFEDTSVKEIIINGADEIWFEQNGQLIPHHDQFLTSLTFKNFVDRICSEAQIKVDLAQPFADGRWREFRVHIAQAPLTHCSYHLTFRRASEHRWTLSSLQQNNWATAEQMAILKNLINEKKSLLFIGPTGCGKTTVLGACLKDLPSHERVVILEDTDELPRPNAASTKLLARPPLTKDLKEVTLNDLVKQSLRMRPFRLVVGEVRGGEAKDLLMALATGHCGSMGTLHASDPQQALLRLEMLVQMGAPQWNVTAIRQLILLSIDAIVVCGIKNGHRYLEGIFKVAALESFGFLVEPL